MGPEGKDEMKIRVAILVGGPSSEYEVSLMTGENVLKSFDPEKFTAETVVIDKSGEWPFPPEELPNRFDVAFIAMHGTYGEDGTIQAILEEASIPYTGSGKLSSALGMNKFLSLRLFRDAGLTIPPTLHFHLYPVTPQQSKFSSDRGKDYKRTSKEKNLLRTARSNGVNDFEKHEDEVVQKITWYLEKPWVIKPNAGGSSIGVVMANSEKELREVLREAARTYKDVLVQPLILGREVTCGVVDHGTHGSAFALPPTEIVPRVSNFFDYKAKYDSGGSDEITPARFPESYLREFRNIALKAHHLTGCRGFSRTDMMVGKDGKIYVLEINTIPGLTSESLLPKAAHTYGISFQKLLEMLVEAAFTSHKKKS